MAWDPSRLFAAFSRHGMLAAGVFDPAGQAVAFACSLQQPDVLLLGGGQQSTDYQIEYESTGAPALVEGSAVQITWRGITAQYVVRSAPMAQGDGTYTRADLSKTS